MTITEFREAVIELCENSKYPENEDEIKSASVMVRFDREGLMFHASTARKIAEGNHQTIYVREPTIEKCLVEFENKITINQGVNNIELE